MAYVDKVSLDGTLYDITDTKGRAMIAPKEATSTAGAAHAAGSYFTYNDLLYRATADIAVGGTITPNTNCVTVTVGAETSELKSAFDQLEIQHLNLYSGINNTLERYINSDTGALIFSGSFQTSDFIDVTAYRGRALVVSYSFSGAFYDATKTFIAGSGFGASSANLPDLVLTVPQTASYVRVTCNNDDTGKLQIGESVSRDNYIDYSQIKIANLDLNNYFTIENLFNTSTCLANKYIAPANGAIGNLTDYYVSDWIEIGADNYVTVSQGAWDVVAYNENKTFSRAVSRKYDNYIYTTKLTGTEKYIRITVYKANLYAVKVENNIGASVFVPFGGALSSKYQEDTSYKLTTVYVGGGCYFETINSALTAIADNTSKNRYKIIVTEGTYNETITTKDYVDIEGESLLKSIINYVNADEEHLENYSAIYASTFSCIKNLTVRTFGSKYPLHCDARYNEPYDFKAENCIFVHDGFTDTERGGTAVGIGLHWGQHVTIKNCECIGIKTGSAAIYCHNDNESTAAKCRYRSVRIENCALEAGTYGVRLQAIETVANQNKQANCCFYNNNRNTAPTAFSLEATEGATQSWHVMSGVNTPAYGQ